MPKGIFSAALSGLASLSLFTLVLFVTLKTAPPASGLGGAGVSLDSGITLPAADIAQQKQLLLEYLTAGRGNDVRRALRVIEENNRGAATRQAIEADFRRREYFADVGAPQFTARNCVRGDAGMRCDVSGVVHYPEGGRAFRDFTAQFIKTPKGWRMRGCIIAPNLKQ